MLIEILLLLFGLALLLKGADWLVEGASSLAKRYNVSDLAIGLTIVAFGTSAPELVVNTYASVAGHDDIVYGNIIGSNNFNLFIILGITGLITPLVVQHSTVWKEIPLSLGGAAVVFILANDFAAPAGQSAISHVDGMLLLFVFAFFLYFVYRQLRQGTQVLEVGKQLSTTKTWLFIALGLGGLVFGGKMVLDNSVEIAIMLGLSQKIIGLTVVAAGTSLPELATSVVAATKKNTDIAVGNIIGSNIFNIFFILAISSLLKPLSYSGKFDVDLYILAGGTVFLFLSMFIGQKKKLKRWQAAILLLSYIGYTAWLIGKGI